MNEPAWPPDFTAWQPDDWSAFGTCLTAVIAIVAAGVAWRQVREAARLRREQAEPYIAVYLEVSAAVSEAANQLNQFIDLVVRNFGSTAAYDIELKIEPEPRRSRDHERMQIPETIRTLVPGQEWRAMWDFIPKRRETDLPDLHEAVVTFFSQAGSRKRRHQYRYQLDFATYKDLIAVTVYGAHDAAKALREISKEVKGWSEHGGGLSVVARDGDARDQELREYAADRRDHAERDASDGQDTDEQEA